ncbi:Protein O-mannosyl-transferase TMTC4 (Transmembrane and TPR repeat-containing protein 4) [Durusdinium trenchii]|uniref:dolichyl-phosphate-mannose--protein mannosyltransferase n=1 Tax=Durusdinium trenchii TaxID=1381693 RepID=A0ABP0IG53_9DINO
MWADNSHRSYRPLTVLSFRVEWVGLEHTPAQMHLVNVLLHAAVTALVAAELADDAEQALVAGLVFAVHPVHVEAVAGLVGRAELLCALLYVAAFIALRRWYASARPAWAVASVVAMLLSTLCKEIGVTFVALALSFGTGRQIERGLPVHRAVASSLVSQWPFLVVAAAYMAFRAWLIGSAGLLDLRSSGLIRKTENPLLFEPPGLHKALSLQVVFLKYAELLVCPTTLCAEYSFDCIKMVRSWHDSRLAGVAIMYAVGIVVAAAAARDLFVHRSMSLALKLAWLVVPFLPSSHLFVTIGTLVAERVLYLPSIGYCLLVAQVAPRLVPSRLVRLAALAAVVAVFWDRTARRIPDWSDDASLFLAAVETCPDSAKLNLQAAQVYRGRGDLDMAQRYLDRAAEIHPDYCDLDLERGMLLFARMQVHAAADRLIASLECTYTSTRAIEVLRKLWDHPVMKEDFPELVLEQQARVLRLSSRAEEAVQALGRAAALAEHKGNQPLAKRARAQIQEIVLVDEDAPPPEDCLAAFQLGEAMHRVGQDLGKELLTSRFCTRVIATYREALKCQETLVGAVTRLVPWYSAALGFNPRNASLHRQLADVLALPFRADPAPDPALRAEYLAKATEHWATCARLAPASAEGTHCQAQAVALGPVGVDDKRDGDGPDVTPAQTANVKGAAGEMARFIVVAVLALCLAGGARWLREIMDPAPVGGKQPHWNELVPNLRSMEGRNVVVTGANTGIGWDTAVAMEKLGATVIVACRSPEKGKRTVRELNSARVHFLPLDLADLRSVDAFAAAFIDQFGKLDVLILNAGVDIMFFAETEQGIEMNWGVNHVASQRLVAKLRPAMERSTAPPGQKRVLVLTSFSHWLLDKTDFDLDRLPFSAASFPSLASTFPRVWRRMLLPYSTSKVANILFTVHLAKVLKPLGFHSMAVHPGIIATTIGTPRFKSRPLSAPGVPLIERGWDLVHDVKAGLMLLGSQLFWATIVWQKTWAEGAATTVWCAAAEELDGDTGLYYEDVERRSPAPFTTDPALARRLWDHTDALIASVVEDQT